MQAASRRPGPSRQSVTLLFGVTGVVSVYLLQRGLADLMRWAEFRWSSRFCMSFDGLQISSMTMTLAWPLVLAGLCITTRRLLERHQSGVSAFPVTLFERPVSPLGSRLADELRQPFPRLVWSALSL